MMCDCDLIVWPRQPLTRAVMDDQVYDPLHRCLELALQIKKGECEPVSAGHLLSSLAYGGVVIDQLPVSLGEIEDAAGRRLHDPIV